MEELKKIDLNIKEPFQKLVSFKEALMMGQAPDAGLFMPNKIPKINIGDLTRLKGNPYYETAFLVTREFLKGEISDSKLERIVKEAYNFDVPLERVYDRKYLMRLDQGPTASFKDFAARMMARLMSYLRDKGKILNVLVATSGDTGSAVGWAFKGLPGINVYIEYPKGLVTGRQKKQLDSIGENVRAGEVDTDFDGCQYLVKRAFNDPELKHLNLTSANSINIGRILPQIAYYFYAYSQLASSGEKIIFSVPSGNFGNALGCEFARRMGLPISKLIMATNENREFPDYLATGKYKKIEPSIACLSNAMNVGNPSNLARFFDLYSGTVDKNGKVHVYPDLGEIKKHIFSTDVSDSETKETIKEAYTSYQIVLEPHGAVGWLGLQRYLKETHNAADNLAVSLETAHPAKFYKLIKEILGFEPQLPPSLKDLDLRAGKPDELKADYEGFKSYLIKNLKATA